MAVTVTGGSAAAYGLAHHYAAARPATALDAPAAVPAASNTASAPGSTFHVVGLGDSVPSGSQCSCTSFVPLVGQELAGEHGQPAMIDNLAHDGLTTAGLLSQVQQSTVRSKIADADVVIITIGANDFDEESLTDDACQPVAVLACYQAALTAQRSELSAILTWVDAATGPSVRTVLTGYWNVFLDGQVGADQGDDYVAGSDALTRADDSLIESVASAHSDTYVDIYTPFKGDDGSTDDTGLLAPDGDHPNAAGHRLIAQTVIDALTGA